MDLDFRGFMVLVRSPWPDFLSVRMVVGGCAWCRAWRMFRSILMFWVLVNMAAISASAAEASTCGRMVDSMRMGHCCVGVVDVGGK